MTPDRQILYQLLHVLVGPGEAQKMDAGSKDGKTPRILEILSLQHLTGQKKLIK